MDVRNRFTIQSDIQAMTKYGLKNAVEYLRLLDAYKDSISNTCSLALLVTAPPWIKFIEIRKD